MTKPILLLWLVSVSTDDYAYTFTTQNPFKTLDCNMAGVSSASSNHITIRNSEAKIQLPVRKLLLLGALALKCCSQMDFKGPHHNGKDLLINRKDPWAESKDLKGLL